MDDDLNFLGLIDDDEVDLADAALTLAALDHAGIDLAPYHELLDEMTARLEAIGGRAGTAADRADALGVVLAGEFGLMGDTATYDHPDNADLIRVLDRRQGLPVSLAIIWVTVARRLGWDADVLDVPGHVLVLVGSEADPVIIDPFSGGGRVDGARIQALVRAFGQDDRDPAVTHVAVMPEKAILVRLLQNQASRAEQAGHGRRALALYERMTVMAPATVHAWWQRARLELVDGDVKAARASLGSILEVTRDPGVRQRAAETLESLPSA